MSDDLDELDAALRRAMAALDGDAPAGYFEALPGRTLARLDRPDDPEIHELPEQPARPLRAVQGLQSPADADENDDDVDDDDDGAAFASQVMAAVELPEEAQPDVPPRRDRASSSSGITRAVDGAASGGERAKARTQPASASSVGIRAVAVDVEAGELGDPRDARVGGAELGVRDSSSSTAGLPVPPVELARPEPAAGGARSTGVAGAMTEVRRGRPGHRVRAAILGIGGIGVAAVAVMYLRAGDRTPRSASSGAPSSDPSIVSNRGPTSPSAASGASASSPAAGSAASAGPGDGAGTVISARSGAEGGPGSGSTAPPAAAAGSGVVPGIASGSASATGKLGEISKRLDDGRPLSKSGGEKPVAPPGRAAGKGGGEVKQAGTGADALRLPDESGGTGKKRKSARPRPDPTSLSGDDIERGMTAVAGPARACFARTEGTASLRLTVAPSGRVVLVAVIGAFAGTPAAACVKRVVLGATFPAWVGAPQSFDYSYQLSD